jgi:uncharacterized membrane protein
MVGAILGQLAATLPKQLPIPAAIARLPVVVAGILIGARVALALGSP